MASKDYIKLIKLDSLPSTNDYAFDLAVKGAQEITVVRANSQTQGRGRFLRRWFSPEGKGLYLSFILRPQVSLGAVSFLPLFFSLGVAKALNGIVNAKIKWPNDVMVKDKKIAGVLVETKTTGLAKVDFVVAGLGININSKKEELPKEATSLYLQKNKLFDLEELFNKITKEVISLYQDFKKGNLVNVFKEVGKFSHQEPIPKVFLERYSFLRDIFSKEKEINFNLDEEDLRRLINIR